MINRIQDAAVPDHIKADKHFACTNDQMHCLFNFV